MTLKVFLSYSSDDVDFAEIVEGRLRAADIEVWRDQGELVAGEDWSDAIDQGIDWCDVVVLVLTRAAIRSSYVTYEWAFALGKGKRVIPLLREPTETHPVLDRIQNEDFTNHRARPWDRLVAAVNGVPVGVPAEPTDAATVARDRVLAHLDATGYRMVSFERVRSRVDDGYDDEFLEGVIQRFPDEFRRARLKGGKPGMARLG